MESYLQEEWAALDQNMINALISSSKERFNAVLEEEGKSIGHRLNEIAKRVRDMPFKDHLSDLS